MKIFNIHKKLTCKQDQSKKYRYRTDIQDGLMDYYWNESPTAPGFEFKNKYSNIYNPLFDQQLGCPSEHFLSITSSTVRKFQNFRYEPIFGIFEDKSQKG